MEPNEQTYDRVARYLDGERLELSAEELALVEEIRRDLQWADQTLDAPAETLVVDRARALLAEALEISEHDRRWFTERLERDLVDDGVYDALAARTARRQRRREKARSLWPMALAAAAVAVLAMGAVLLLSMSSDPKPAPGPDDQMAEVSPEIEQWMLADDAEMDAQLDALEAALAILAAEDVIAPDDSDPAGGSLNLRPDRPNANPPAAPPAVGDLS